MKNIREPLTILVNLRHAVRNNETVTIGGGQFNPGELQELIDYINLAVQIVNTKSGSNQNDASI